MATATGPPAALREPHSVDHDGSPTKAMQPCSDTKGNRSHGWSRWAERSMVLAAAVTLLLTAWVIAQVWSLPRLSQPQRQSSRVSRVKAFLAANHSSTQLLRLPNRGLACRNCCVSLRKPVVGNRTVGTAYQRYLSVGTGYETVWVTRAHPRQTVPGTTYLVWSPPYQNTLFGVVEAANSWRTVMSLQGVKFDRVMLLRPAHGLSWLYKHLTKFTASLGLSAMPQRGCFQKLMLGSVHFTWQPYNWPTLCSRPLPEFNDEEAEWLAAFRQQIVSTLPYEQKAEGKVPCRAVMQLRGGPMTSQPVETRGRNLLNTEAVINTLTATGFSVEAIDLRKQSIVQSAVSHRDAHLVVAPHGAGIVNVVFCKPNVTLVELHNWGAQNYLYERFARTLGLSYVPLHCKSQDDCPVNSNLWRRAAGKDAAPPGKASEDLCLRGLASAEKFGYYATNHTLRDIRADIDRLAAVARELMANLTARGVCEAVPLQ